jgi:lambda family phage tail tape measure protein
MADRSLAIRLSVTDAAKVKATLTDVGESGQRALKKVEDASRPASKALLALDGAAGHALGSMEAMSGRLGTLGAALTRLGPAGMAAGGTLATVGAGLVRGIQDAAEAERSYRRLEAVLNATGHSAGLTGRQITAFAEEMERSTLASTEGVQDAAAVLATFRSISGDTFTRTLQLAQDMVTVFGGDLSSAATQLGKALEDPIDGLSALRRVGITFSESQRDVIRVMMDTGRVAEAQGLILDALEKQVGGSGAAGASGLTGATNRLSDAWGNFLEELANTTGAAAVAQNALNAMAGVIEKVTGWLRGGELDAQIGALEDRVSGLRHRVGTFVGPLGKMFGMEAPAPLKMLLEQEEQQLADLKRQRDEAAATAKTEEEKARAGQLAAEAERRQERLSQMRTDAEKEMKQYATTAERKAAVDQAFADKRKQLEALRTAENAGEIDKQLKLEEDLHRRQVAQIDATEAKRGAAGARRAAAAEKAAAREATRNAELIDQMTRDLQTVTDERQQSIDQALSRLSDSATEAQRAEVTRLAGALYDQKEAQEAADDAKREGIRWTQSLLTPSEEYAATLQRITELLNAEAITEQTASRARAQAVEDFADAADFILRQSRVREDGIRRALGDYLDEATNAAKSAQEITEIAFQGMEDALTDMVTKGKLDFRSMSDSIVADITRIAIKQAILTPLAQGLMGSGIAGPIAGSAAASGAGAADAATAAGGGWLSGIGKSVGSWLASWFHEGGIVGESLVARRPVDASVFLNAPRYHTGGYLGLKPDEMPAILQRGERVLSRSQVAAGLGQSRSPVNVVMNITTPDVGGFRQSQAQIAADAARTLVRVQRRNL